MFVLELRVLPVLRRSPEGSGAPMDFADAEPGRTFDDLCDQHEIRRYRMDDILVKLQARDGRLAYDRCISHRMPYLARSTRSCDSALLHFSQLHICVC